MPIFNEEQFWGLIDQARSGKLASASPEQLHKLLSRLSDDEVLSFGHTFYEKLCDLNQWRLWAAGYVIAGGMSDDSFHYFRSWIIGKGRDAFEVAMKNPDELGPFVDNNEVDNELLEYVAVKVLEREASQKTHETALTDELMASRQVNHSRRTQLLLHSLNSPHCLDNLAGPLSPDLFEIGKVPPSTPSFRFPVNQDLSLL